MIGPTIRDKWLALLCDLGSATLLAARGDGANATLLARRHVEFDPQRLRALGRLAALEAFVDEQELRGAPAYLALAGAGAVAQVLHVPRLSARNRKRAIRTRLESFAAGQHLTVAARAESPMTPQGGAVLAAGVDTELARGLLAACEHARVQVRSLTALVGVAPAPQPDGVAVQVLLGERTTTIQVFRSGRLVACRDVLLGRRDFVQAYQRPILTEDGATTLTAAQAEELFTQAGVPTDQEQELLPGVRGRQLWPTLDPVLQKLRREVEQSLRLGDVQTPGAVGLSVLSTPAVPGLAEFLAADLQLSGPLFSADQSSAALLAGLRSGRPAALDLRPPEVQVQQRLTKPALVAGVAALLTIVANTATPREVRAQLAQIEPAARQLALQAVECRARRDALQQACAELEVSAQDATDLARVLPRGGAPFAPLKTVLATVPAHVRLRDVRYDSTANTPVLELLGVYAGSDPPASVMAAQWARALAGTERVSSADVKQVAGSGRDEPSVFLMEVVLK